MIYYEIQNLYEEHIDEHTLFEKLDRIGGDFFYAFIKHDKDKKPNGQFKKVHFHCIVGTETNNKKAKAEVEQIAHDLYEDTMVKNVRNIQNALCYLIHKKDKSKYQYKFDDIITNNREICDELINSFVPVITNTELMLNDFMDYLLKLDYEPPYMELMKWFRERNSLNYFIQHHNQINQLVGQVFNTFHHFNKELEERGIEKC